jgi:hypothetical protein
MNSSTSRRNRIKAGYDVGTNTAALPTVNALFHSIVSSRSFLATIYIVSFYVGSLLPSPESIRIGLSSISIPNLKALDFLPFVHYSN